jgi:hypothetical protein
LPPNFSKIHSNAVFWVFAFLQVFKPKYCTHFSSPPCVSHASPPPPHPHWFDHPNNIWWNAQFMKFLIMQSSLVSRHLLPLRSKYSPEHRVLRYSQSMFFP